MVEEDDSSFSSLQLQIPCEARCLGTRLTHSKKTTTAEGSHWSIRAFLFLSHILPETNIAPATNPLEKEIPIGNHHF